MSYERAGKSPPSGPPAGLRVIACEVMAGEVGGAVEALGGGVRLELVEQGLHNEPDQLRTVLQTRIDAIDAELRGGDGDVAGAGAEAGVCGAIVLMYGLCSRGIEGLSSARHRLVVPRAHDCITVLLGSRERYASFTSSHPGIYWYSSGWNRCHVPPGPERHESRRRAYAAQYGEDNADYLMEMEQGWFSTYNRAVYIATGAEDDAAQAAYTKRCADWLGWSYESVRGDDALIVDALRGRWDSERFLVVEPGESIRMTADERIIEATVNGRRPGADGDGEAAEHG